MLGEVLVISTLSNVQYMKSALYLEYSLICSKVVIRRSFSDKKPFLLIFLFSESRRFTFVLYHLILLTNHIAYSRGKLKISTWHIEDEEKITPTFWTHRCVIEDSFLGPLNCLLTFNNTIFPMTQNESDRYLGDSGHHKEDQGGSTKSKSSLVTPMMPFSPYTFFVTKTLCLCNIQYSRGERFW